MRVEAFLERVPDADVSFARCSICKQEFHSSPIGPRKPMSDFWNHIADKHPNAVYTPDRTRLLWKK